MLVGLFVCLFVCLFHGWLVGSVGFVAGWLSWLLAVY